MIEGAEAIYRAIANEIVQAIHGEWTEARIDTVEFSDANEFSGDFTLPSGKIRDFAVSMQATCAFWELRRKFAAAGQPLWGQAQFVLKSTGEFELRFDYDNCDADGNSLMTDEEWRRRREERRLRLLG